MDALTQTPYPVRATAAMLPLDPSRDGLCQQQPVDSREGFFMPDHRQRQAPRRTVLQELGELQDWKCHYCDRPVVGNPLIPKATIDHVIPRAAGGTDDPENLVLACHRCNSSKHTRSYEEFVGTVRIQEFWWWEIIAIAGLRWDELERLGCHDPGDFFDLMAAALDGYIGKPMPGYVSVDERLGEPPIG